MQTNKAREYHSPIIEEIKNRISPAKRELTMKRMLLAARIDDKIRERGLSNQESAYMMMMGKKPSEISKWLSGTHNFTTETLWEIERVLNIQLVAGPISPSREQELNEMKAFVAEEVMKALDKYIAFKAVIA
jgi:ribosome-binding protein aMBF1 (putative translation factor)